MAQYGAPKDPRDQKRAAGYGSDPKKQEPSVKQEDPSPPVRVVDAFHKNAGTSRATDIHHRLGGNPGDAAEGTHTHNGSDSPLLLEGVIIAGSRGGNAALPSIIAALTKLGAKDSTTP